MDMLMLHQGCHVCVIHTPALPAAFAHPDEDYSFNLVHNFLTCTLNITSSFKNLPGPASKHCNPSHLTSSCQINSSGLHAKPSILPSLASFFLT
eukprot:1157694-Pelagomonas_calceolata.AAC.21